MEIEDASTNRIVRPNTLDENFNELRSIDAESIDGESMHGESSI